MDRFGRILSILPEPQRRRSNTARSLPLGVCGSSSKKGNRPSIQASGLYLYRNVSADIGWNADASSSVVRWAPTANQ
jgi:hypothetical protein